MSPWPSRFSAPFMSSTVRESVLLATWKAIREGKLALMTPVITSTDGRWVASTRWIPTARAIWARRAIGSSISAGAVSIRSASSSITTTTYESRSGTPPSPPSGCPGARGTRPAATFSL